MNNSKQKIYSKDFFVNVKIKKIKYFILFIEHCLRVTNIAQNCLSLLAESIQEVINDVSFKMSSCNIKELLFKISSPFIYMFLALM